MQIYGPSQLHGAQPISAPHAARAHESNSVSQPSSSIGDRLDISEAGQIAGRMAEIPDIRADRVQELRTAILNGSYESDAKLDVALERLLDEIA
jgi:negative regulator of flagellin synthesis FlgM